MPARKSALTEPFLWQNDRLAALWYDSSYETPFFGIRFFGIIRERLVKGDQVIGVYYGPGLGIFGWLDRRKWELSIIFLEMGSFLHLFYEQALRWA
jgi:hypothetical protein